MSNITIETPKDESSDSQERNLALAAVLLAIVAFLIAFFQVLLQYLTSSKREKCLSGAIGGWSRYTKTRWDFRTWRLHVSYPVVDFSLEMIDAILNRHPRAVLSEWVKKQDSPFSDNTVVRTDFHSLQYFGPIALQCYAIVDDDGKILTFWDLGLREKWSWLRLVMSTPQEYTARAGWANLLCALGVIPKYDNEDLLGGSVDADLIPSTVDVPLQKANLYDILTLCYVLGQQGIRFDTKKKTLSTNGPSIMFSTQNIPGIGQVISIDGDFSSLRKSILERPEMEFLAPLYSARGNFSMGRPLYTPSLTTSFLYPAALLHALKFRWDHDIMETYKKKFIEQPDKNLPASIFQRSPYLQALDFQTKFSTSGFSWEKFWKSKGVGGAPSIIISMAFLPYACMWTAMPKIIIEGFQDQIDQDRGINMASWRSLSCPLLLECSQILEMGLYSNMFRLASSDDHSILKFCKTLSRSWINTPTRPVLNGWDEVLVESILNYSKPLPLPSVVIDLLSGETKETAEKKIGAYFRNIWDAAIDCFCYTLDQAIYLSLLILEARLEALWCAYEDPDQPLSFYYAFVFDVANTREPTRDDADVEVSDFPLGKQLANFLALWLEISQKINPLADIVDVIKIYNYTLDDWKTKTMENCLEPLDLPKEINDFEDSKFTSPEEKQKRYSGSKAEFSEWMDINDRRSKLQNLLPLLQLRIFLMNIIYMRHSDSSKLLEPLDHVEVKIM